MKRGSLVIVGAGPAGMSAAITAARAGLRPLLVDENPRPGGQIYRQSALSRSQPQQVSGGEDLFRELEELKDRIEIKTGAAVWGMFPPRQVAIAGQPVIEADYVILAPGAYEYVPPFAGWTLPGVMTPGGAQTLVKTQGVLPGRRALVAGTGPFLLVVAEQLRRAGVEVAAVIEMSSTGESIRALPRLLLNPRLLWEGLQYLRRLRKQGVPILRGRVLLEARGDGEVREAIHAPCDRDGNPDRAGAQSIEVDTICVGYGFVPRIQLAQLAGCRLHFVEAVGGWIPIVDDDLETTVANVWVAGDGGGVAGVLVARLEGTLAGLAVAHRAGTIRTADFAVQRGGILRRLGRLRRFRAVLDRLFRIRPGLVQLAGADTFMCRCEEVTRAEIEAGIAAGGTNLPTLKVMTRAGMGPCQGQMCWPALARFLACATRSTPEAAGPLSVRPPIMPVPMQELAQMESSLSED